MLANSDGGALNGAVTKDGYVEGNKALTNVTARTLNTAAQISTTIAGVLFAYKITAITTDGNVDITASATTVSTGDAQAIACVLSGVAWYCPVPVADTSLGIVVTKDGYVQDTTSLAFTTDRTAAGDAQVTAKTGSVKTAYKITSILTDGNADITLTATSVSAANGPTACVLYSGAWYCPVLLAGATLGIQVTKDGYVEDASSLVFSTDRAAAGDAQVLATTGSVKTAYKIATLMTEANADIALTATTVKTGNTQGTTCVP